MRLICEMRRDGTAKFCEWPLRKANDWAFRLTSVPTWPTSPEEFRTPRSITDDLPEVNFRAVVSWRSSLAGINLTRTAETAT